MMKQRTLVIAGAVAAVIVVCIAGLFVYVFYSSPRMKEQLHVRAFQALAPLPPPGTIPVEIPASLPPAGQGAAVRNPLQADKGNIARGAVYYVYYCRFCHGDAGDGNGQVGQSYVPKPADLRTAKIRGYADGQLLRSMLTGVGHDPVLEQVVPAEHRWYLVLYVRSLTVKK